LGFIGLHLERLIVLSLFIAMLIVMMKHRPLLPRDAPDPATH